MQEVNLTEAVCHAVMTADSLVRVYGGWSDADAAPDSFVGMLSVLHQWICKSNSLVGRASEFIGHYATPPEPAGGVSGSCYHEQGRMLALVVINGVRSAAFLAAVVADHTRNGDCFDAVAPDTMRDNWPAVCKYLRDEAPHFDSSRLIAMIRDEGVRAERAEVPPVPVPVPPVDVPQKDGPISPDRFAWEGKVYDGLTSKRWVLVKCLWSAQEWTMTFGELAMPVWGDSEQLLNEDQVSSVRREVNKFFSKWAIPLRIRVVTTGFGVAHDRQYTVRLLKSDAGAALRTPREPPTGKKKRVAGKKAR